MGGCRCTFRNCPNNSSNSPGVHFFHFPNKQFERCQKWAVYSDNLNFLDLPASQLRNKVICEEHFYDECFMNYKKERLVQQAVPTLFRLQNGMVLDYSESDNPKPKLLPAASSEHLVPPEKRDLPETEILGDMEEGSFSIVVEQLEELSNDADINEFPNQPINTSSPTEEDILCEFIEVDNVSSPPMKIQKVYTNVPKILNQEVFKSNPRKFPKRNKNTYKNFQAKESPLKSFKNASNIIQKDNLSSENLILNIEDTQSKTILKIEPQNIVNKLFKNPSNIIQKDNSILENSILNINENVQSNTISNVAKNDELKVIETIPPLKPDVSSIPDYIREMTVQPPIIQEVKSSFTEKPNTAGIIQQKTETTQVETITTSSYKPETINPIPLTKAQLFNSIKKYLSPSMAALVRMEMFATPDRVWKSDEKDVSVEILRLGHPIFNYFRDEWRLRLPPKKDVEQWLNASSIIEDEEEL